MTLLFKALGFVLIITTSTTIGFLKANTLNLRVKKLQSLAQGITQLKELIRLGGGEIDKIAKQSFDSFPIDYSSLSRDDCEIAESLFKEIGLLDTEAAYNRCNVCLSLLNTRHTEALQKCRELGKMYKSVGALFGVFICIFFI